MSVLSYFKKFGICIVALVLCIGSIMPAAASDEYVTVDVPLAWETDKFLDYSTGQETSNSTTGSVTDYFSVIEGATYNVSLSGSNTIQNGCVAFYYDANKSFISYQALWLNKTGAQSVDLVIPAGAAYIRLTSDLLISDNNSQNTVQLQVTVSATYIDDSGMSTDELAEYITHGYEGTGVSDASDRFDDAFSEYQEQEQALTGDAKQYANDYAADAFNTNLLDELGETVTFVVTWFTNFWNLGGTFTAVLSMLFAISIVMYILRIK